MLRARWNVSVKSIGKSNVNINWQLMSFTLVALINVVAIVSAYYGLKADNAATVAKLDVSLVAERAARSMENLSLKAVLIDMLRLVEQDVRQLSARLGTLEGGQDEWTKSLRERSHELSDSVNSLVLKVDRLERPLHAKLQGE